MCDFGSFGSGDPANRLINKARPSWVDSAMAMDRPPPSRSDMPSVMQRMTADPQRFAARSAGSPLVQRLKSFA